MDKHITKRMSQLSKVQRGLDRSHPEFKKQSIDKLAQHLNKAMSNVHQLEQQHNELGFRIMVAKMVATDAVIMLTDKFSSNEEIESILIELIETLDGVEASV